MPEYGKPQRNAVDDANAGIVNTPSVRTRNRQATIKQRKTSSLDEGVSSFGAAFGNAAQKLIQDEAANIREQKALDAAIRQGNDKALNTVDANEKRTGAFRAVFGQDAGYEEAQKRAVENSIQAMYIEQATQIDTYAGETPEEYSVRLKKSLDGMLDKYPNDADTKKRITASWVAAGQKLSAKQLESHVAWTQMQNRMTFAQRTRQNFDTLMIDSQLASSPEEYMEVIRNGAKQYDMSDKPDNMDAIAWRSVKNEELNNALRAGNIGPYFAARSVGWNGSLNPAEKVAQVEAISAYDTDFDQQASVFIEDAKLGEAKVNSVEEAREYWNTLDTRINTLEQRSTDTERARLTIAKARRIAAEARKSLITAGLKANSKADRQAHLQAILRERPDIQAAEFSAERQTEAGAFKKVEVDAALDANVIEDVRKLTGQEDLEDKDVIRTMLGDPSVAMRIAESSKQARETAPIIKEAANTLINGWDRMVDDQGRPTQELTTFVNSVAQFAQDDNKFKAAVGDDNYKKWLLLQRGITNGNSAEKIQKETDKFFENKGKLDKWKLRWPLAEDQTHQQYVASLVSNFGGGFPQGSAMTYYMEEFQDGLQIYDGDFHAAKNYLKTTVKNNSLRSGSVVVQNGKHLDNVSEDYSFNELIKTMENPRLNWMGDVISQMLGNNQGLSGGTIKSLEELADYEMYVIPGIDGVYINSQSADRPVRIPAEVLRAAGREQDKIREFEERRLEKDAEAISRQWEAEEEYKPYLPPIMQ